MASTTTPATSKAELLSRADGSYRSMRDALGAIAPARAAERTAAGWTFIDLVAHFAAWEATVPESVPLALAGEADPRYADPDAYNVTILERSRGLARDAALADWDQAHVRLQVALRDDRVPDPVPPAIVDLVRWNTYEHFPDHYAEIALGKAELLAAVDAGWRRFREAVRGLGRARIGERTTGGWTYRDLIAHVAAWEALTARRLDGFRETGTAERPPGTADEFNAKVVAAHALVGPEALHDELDTSHRALVAAISRLDEDQLRKQDGWVGAIVAGNTYGHYAEHIGEWA